jgi:vacuolar-type H+-ATPase subunit C/Vma6
MDMLAFNIDHAYPEALVRQLRKSFLDDTVYTNLKSCNNLTDFKMVLEETDYHGIVSQSPEIEITDLKSKCR